MRHNHPIVADKFETNETGTSSFDDVAIAGAATIGETLAVTGVITATAGVTGAITGNITGNVTGNLTGDLTPAAETAEHGAGAIGTAATPTTYRWVENGVIITRIKLDLTGLASVADADDVIGLAAGGAAYVGRNVVATNGIIFKVQMACLETPAGGDNDINLTTSSSAVAAHDTDGAAFGVVHNAGDWVAGTCRENLVPALTANDYYYLTAGTGDTADTYTAGMFLITTYGHAALA